MASQIPQPALIKTQMGLREWLMLGLLAAIWGGSFLFIGVAVKELPPLTIVALRVLVAAGGLWAFIIVRGIRMPTAPRAWQTMAVMGLINNALPFTMLVWGQTHIASGLASILNGTTPLFAVILAGWLLPDERITMQKVAGVIVGFVGAVVVIGPESLSGLGGGLLPQLACVAAGLCYAAAGVYWRRSQFAVEHPLVVGAGMLTASSLMMVPTALVIERPWELAMPGFYTWGAVCCLGLLSTAVTYNLYFRLIATAGATNITLVTLLIPVSAILLGTLFLGERLAAADFIGMAVIGLGLVIIDGRLLKPRAQAGRA